MLPWALIILTIPTILAALLPSVTHAHRRSGFTRPALIRTSAGLGEITDATLVAWADFNADRFTDALLLSGDQHSLQVHLWDHVAAEFVAFVAGKIYLGEERLIVNAITTDVNHDGHVDVLVQFKELSATPSPTIHQRVYFGSSVGAFDAKYATLPSANRVLPIPFDVSGNTTTDLLGYAEGSDSLTLWEHNVDAPDLYSTRPFLGTESMKGCILSDTIPGHAFVDLDGDCLADIFLVCQPSPTAPSQPSFLILRNTKSLGLQFHSQGLLPKGSGLPSFADVDGDGAIDIVVPACATSTSCAIHIFYNLQMRLCESASPSMPGSISPCRPLANLCLPDPAFHFNTTLDASNSGYAAYPISDLIPTASTILLHDSDFAAGTLPVAVQLGDYNSDGYPDMLVMAQSPTGTRAYLLESVSCTMSAGQCGHAATVAERRYFKLVTDGASALTDIPMATAASFVDLDEDGCLDIIILSKSTASASKGLAARKMTVLENAYDFDAFFLKTQMLLGDPQAQQGGISSRRPSGVGLRGASFRYTIIDAVGRKSATAVAQQCQSGIFALQTPYNLIGLGRTNNYVEELYGGSTHKTSVHYSAWTGIIPNSQLIVEPRLRPESQELVWTRDLLINPAHYTWIVILVLGITMLILLTIVVTLDVREKQQDKKEREEARHIINFDAL